ncbi:uncharacterized protein BcabD6B2_31620 [Babesia caballi]|uniref:Secreted protein n=1 Tax=Babesia caballi TaxID=5871 RepID=A0AAV4LU02_BABCB|nr:hypothetical protein BcabD6B2_31620 [Babesia caballi]
MSIRRRWLISLSRLRFGVQCVVGGPFNGLQQCVLHNPVGAVRLQDDPEIEEFQRVALSEEALRFTRVHLLQRLLPYDAATHAGCQQRLSAELHLLHLECLHGVGEHGDGADSDAVGKFERALRDGGDGHASYDNCAQFPHPRCDLPLESSGLNFLWLKSSCL